MYTVSRKKLVVVLLLKTTTRRVTDKKQVQKGTKEVKKMKQWKGIVVFAIIIMSVMSLAVAIDPEAGLVDSIGANTTKSAGSADSVTAVGGNISNVDFQAEEQTSVWGGFFGSISRIPVLYGGTNEFYTWTGTVSYTTGYVLFANSSSVDWGNVIAGGTTQAGEEDTALGLSGDADSVANTFTSHNSVAINLTNDVSAGSALSVNTSSQGGTDWETVLLYETGTNSKIYTGIVQQGNNNYAGVASDYQVMVPTDGTTRTYYVFLALE